MNPQTKDKLYWRVGWLVMALVVGSFLWGYCGCVTPKMTVRDSPITTSGPAGPQSESPSQSPGQQGTVNFAWQQAGYSAGAGAGGVIVLLVLWRSIRALRDISLRLIETRRNNRRKGT